MRDEFKRFLKGRFEIQGKSRYPIKVFSYPGSEQYETLMVVLWNLYRIHKELEIDRFIEVFGGTGVITCYASFFKERTYNDKDRSLVVLMRTIRDKPFELIKNIEDYLRDVVPKYVRIGSKDDKYRDLVKELAKKITDNEKYDDMDVATWTYVFYKINTRFGSFRPSISPKKFKSYEDFFEKTMSITKRRLPVISKMLQGVRITNRDYSEIVREYRDDEDIVLHMDPPWLSRSDYRLNFDSNEITKLLLRIKDIKPVVILEHGLPDEYVENYNKHRVVRLLRWKHVLITSYFCHIGFKIGRVVGKKYKVWLCNRFPLSEYRKQVVLTEVI